MNYQEYELAIAERLVQYRFVEASLLERARSFQKTRSMTLLRALVELKLVTIDALNRLIEEVTGAATVNPSMLTVYQEYIGTVSKLLPRKLVTEALLFPVQSELNTIRVCMLNPTDRGLVSSLEAVSGCRILPLAGHEQHLAKAITEHYQHPINGVPPTATNQEETHRLIDTIVGEQAKAPMETYSDPAVALINRNRDKLAADPAVLESVIRNPDLIRFVHQMLTRLVHARASDVHLEPMESQYRVRARIDGAMRTVWKLPPAVALATTARLKVMAGLDMKRATEPLDARISYDLVWGREVDFRFSSLPSLHGEKIVLRTLDRSRKRQEMTALGFDLETLDRVKSVAEGPNGLVLVTGPTGSGKTSTLYALVDHLNNDDVNIVTAEDPVESKIVGVTQVHCGEDMGVSFAAALRSFLRQDPDIILVGEIRDQETADIALKAALTGHLVMSTLHTNDAPSTILRLLNMDLDPFMVGAAVRLVLAQRLVRRLCDHCKKPMEGAVHGLTDREAAILKGATIYEPVGCDACEHSGYRGRKGLFEALIVTEPLEELIANKASVVDIRQMAQQQGMKSLREAGLTLAAAGETSLGEVFLNTVGEAPAS